MACTRRGRTPKARSGNARPAPAVATLKPEDNLKATLPVPAPRTDILEAEPLEVLKPFTATGNSARDRVAQWIYFRSAEPGITNAEVARRLGIAPHSLNRILYQARKEGWLQIEDPLTKVEIELLPKVVDNLNYHLDRRDAKVTIEAAKGLLFPLWKEQQGIEENKIQALAIKIEMPPGGQVAARGLISGTPRRPGELPLPVKDAEFSDDNDT